MDENSSGRTDPALLLNKNRLRELRDAHGIGSDTELARRIGVDAVTLWRVTNGSPPSNAVMARILVAFPQAQFAQLFEVK